MKGSAVISDCNQYRYKLERHWDEGPTALFLMLNPSTADASEDDATIRRCISFAKKEGCGSLMVGNCFAFRATDPDELRKCSDPIGALNDAYLSEMVLQAQGPIICAWGTKATYGRRNEKVLKLIKDAGKIAKALAISKDGHPKHPLYLPSTSELVFMPGFQ